MHLHCWRRGVVDRQRDDHARRFDAPMRWKTRGMEAVRLMIGVAILLVIAGTIEGFISPAPDRSEDWHGIGGITGWRCILFVALLGE